MHPVLLQIGDFVLQSYTLMLGLAFLSSMYFTAWRAKKRNLEKNIVYNACFYIVLAGLLGARLLYVLQHLEEFQDNFTTMFNPFAGTTVGIEGFSLFGGAAGAIVQIVTDAANAAIYAVNAREASLSQFELQKLRMQEKAKNNFTRDYNDSFPGDPDEC